MPVIKFTYQEMEDILNISLDHQEFLDMLPMIGSDLEDYDDKEVKVEFFPNRPDHLSVEGVARTLKGFLKLDMGLPHYSLEDSGESLTVDSQLADIRPYIACCLVEGVELDDDKLRQLMDFQEDLHWVLGRDRKKVAIGIHNLDVIKGPYRYIAADPNNMSFIPLDCEEKLTLREILEKHPKGRNYAHLLCPYSRYPLILDSNNEVLSMPPIINGELTKLTTSTSNFFLDVTGTDKRAVEKTLNILATSFAEAGGQIKTMQVIYPKEKLTLPDLTPQKRSLGVKKTNKILGMELTSEEIIKALSRVRMDAHSIDKDTLQVEIPAYRVDILHEVDLAENVAIGYGFPDLKPQLPQISTVAWEDRALEFDQLIRQVLTGLGLVEVMSLMLTNEENHYHNMGLDEDERVEVAQPISQDRTMIRQSLLNGLLEFLEHNKHEDLPQKIFEVGEVIFLDKDAETGIRGIRKLAAMITHSHANFTEAKSLSASVLTNLGLEMNVEPYQHPSFVGGRCAKIKGTRNVDGEQQTIVEGFFGELHPKVVTNFLLEYPVVALELEFK